MCLRCSASCPTTRGVVGHFESRDGCGAIPLQTLRYGTHCGTRFESLTDCTGHTTWHASNVVQHGTWVAWEEHPLVGVDAEAVEQVFHIWRPLAGCADKLGSRSPGALHDLVRMDPQYNGQLPLSRGEVFCSAGPTFTAKELPHPMRWRLQPESQVHQTRRHHASCADGACTMS